MACIKTTNDIVTQPSAPSARQAVSKVAQAPAAPVPSTSATAPPQRIELSSANLAVSTAHRAVRQATSVDAVRQALTEAASALDTARRRGAPANELRALESSFKSLQREADSKIKSLKQKGADRTWREVIDRRTSEAGHEGRVAAPQRTAVALERGGSAHIDYKSLPSARSRSASVEFEQAVEIEWTKQYSHGTRGTRDIRAFTVGSFTWLWDSTTSPDSSEPDNRLIGVYGHSNPTSADRDKGRIRGFPSPQRDNEQPFHRGHATAHSMGGPDEGFNLFGQSGAVNTGARWRALETYCAENPGTFMFMRAAYSDDSDQPSGLEYGVFHDDGDVQVEYFDNR